MPALHERPADPSHDPRPSAHGGIYRVQHRLLIARVGGAGGRRSHRRLCGRSVAEETQLLVIRGPNLGSDRGPQRDVDAVGPRTHDIKTLAIIGDRADRASTDDDRRKTDMGSGRVSRRDGQRAGVRQVEVEHLRGRGGQCQRAGPG